MIQAIRMARFGIASIAIEENIYSNGKSVISFSQLLSPSSPQTVMKNFYVHESIPMMVPDSTNVFRVLISPKIGEKQMNLSINDLKSNKMMKELIQLQTEQKYAIKASRIIVDGDIKPTFDPDTNEQTIQHLQKNMMELEKLLEVGIGLNLSYMISRRCFYEKWIQCLSKKRKAISSDIAEIGVSFEETVYNQGYQLQHVFVQPYKNGQPIESLEQNDAFNFYELAAILNMIDFNGKIILPPKNLLANIEYAETMLRKIGYEKRGIKDFQFNNWVALL